MAFYTCSICWSILQCEESIYRTNCGHLFHRKCLQQWWNSSSECPTCRSECTIHNAHPSYFSASMNTKDHTINDEKITKITKTQSQDDNSNEIALLRKRLEDAENDLKAVKEKSDRKIQLLKCALLLATKEKCNECKDFVNGSRSSFKRIFRFSFTSPINVELMLPELTQQILALNGTLCKHSLEYDPSCTHLITTEPQQSEKTLSIIATGRWLLCPAYITDSLNAGYFLNEENYEWGNPKALSKCPTNTDGTSKKIAAANYQWRKQLDLRSKQENKPVGIFTGFRAIVNSRDNSLTRVLEAGFGVVVDIRAAFWKNTDFKGVTMCFVDKRKMTPADRNYVESAGMVCVDVSYLQDIFINGSLPAVENYII